MTYPVALLAFTIAIQTTVSSGLAGRWDSAARSKGGLGYWYEFSEDGSVSRSIGIMLDGTWTTLGDTLNLTVMTADGRVDQQTLTFKVKGTRLTRSMHGSSQSLDRTGDARQTDDALVGVWRYAHPAGGTAYEQFTEDGRFLFRLPTQSKKGRYSIAGDHLTLDIGGESPKEVRWRIEKGELELSTLEQRAEHPAKKIIFRREAIGAVPVVGR